MSAGNKPNEREGLRTLVTRGDVLVIAALLLLSLSLFVLSLLGVRADGVRRVEISVGGTLCETLPLDAEEAQTRTVEGYGGLACTVEVSGGRVRVSEAQCPDGLCTAQGWIDRPGETIVCLPARVTVTVVAEKTDPAAPDALSR